MTDRGLNSEDKEFSRELRLILDIIKDNGTQFQNQELFIDIDWNIFLEFVSQHRLYPSIYKKFKNEKENKVPSQVLTTLSTWYKRNTFQMLQLSAEMEQVSRWLVDAGIDSLFLKGPVLAYDLYGDLSMRTSKDLDILIQMKDLDKVDQILLEYGYKRDNYTRTVMNDWKWKNHHIEYVHHEKGISLEIHWRMNPGAGKEATFKELWGRKRRSPINHYPVYFLGREDLFIYLVTHGARHGWFRLRWLTDIDQMVKQGLNWNGVSFFFKKYDIKHLGGQALILTHQLLGANIPDNMKGIINKKSISLAQKALLFIDQLENLHNEDLSEGVSKKFSDYLYSLKNFQQKLFYYLGFVFPVLEDAVLLPLPKKLHFLYFLLRPFLWVWRRAKRYSVS